MEDSALQEKVRTLETNTLAALDKIITNQELYSSTMKVIIERLYDLERRVSALEDEHDGSV